MPAKQSESPSNIEVNEEFFKWQKISKDGDKPSDAQDKASKRPPARPEKKKVESGIKPAVPPMEVVVRESGGFLSALSGPMDESNALWKKSVKKVKDNPILPIGLAGVTYCLFGMIRATYQKDAAKVNRYMKARVAIQGFTAIALFAGAAYTYLKGYKSSEHELAEEFAKENKAFIAPGKS